MRSVLNMTGRQLTPAELALGCVESEDTARTYLIKKYLGWEGESPPEPSFIRVRAAGLAELAEGWSGDLLEGPPWMLGALERALEARGIQPFYGFYRAGRVATLIVPS